MSSEHSCDLKILNSLFHMLQNGRDGVYTADIRTLNNDNNGGQDNNPGCLRTPRAVQ